MFNVVLETLFSISLFLFAGNVLDTKFSLHHYKDSDYKEIFFLKNKESVDKHCTKHLKFETIKKINRYIPEGRQEAVYVVTDLAGHKEINSKENK